MVHEVYFTSNKINTYITFIEGYTVNQFWRKKLCFSSMIDIGRNLFLSKKPEKIITLSTS